MELFQIWPSSLGVKVTLVSYGSGEFTDCMECNAFYAPVICIHAPSGPGNSRAFTFSIFKALLKALPCGAKFVVKSLRGEGYNNY